MYGVTAGRIWWADVRGSNCVVKPRLVPAPVLD